MARRLLLTGTVSPVLGSTVVLSPRALLLEVRVLFALLFALLFAPPLPGAALDDEVADFLAVFFGAGSSALAKTGLGAPNFKRTGLSPQISSK